MFIALVLVSAFAYTLIGYILQKKLIYPCCAEHSFFWQRLFVVVVWPPILLIILFQGAYIFVYDAMQERLENKIKKTKSVPLDQVAGRKDDTLSNLSEMGPEIPGMTQVRPGLYVSNYSVRSIFDKSDKK